MKLTLGARIWLSLSILVIAYFISVMLWFFLGQQLESQLNNISTISIPKANQSQRAQTAFDEQVKNYQNAIMMGEATLIDEVSKPKAVEVKKALQAIIAFNVVDPNHETIKQVLKQLNTFTLLAEQTYPKMSSAFDENEESMATLEIQAFQLAKQTNQLRTQLEQLTQRYDTALSNELANISKMTRQQGKINMIMFITVVICTLSLITFIINRSIVKPIQRLVDIAQEVTSDKNNVKWLPTRYDEIGVLNQSLRTMTNNLTAAEKKYRSIFENAMEGIFQITQEGVFISANPAMASILGYDSSQQLIVHNQNIFQAIDEKNLANIHQHLQQKSMVDNMEVQLFRPDGSSFWGTLSLQTIRSSNGEALHLNGSLIDLSERIEKERAERAREVAEAINQKIMESIRYAELIQRSLLPDLNVLATHLPDHFVIWMPRDIVGGDILFVDYCQDGIVFAVVDCTGHGIPGALMSMIASSSLRRITKDEGCYDPAQILNRLNYLVKASLQQDAECSRTNDGMDVAVCYLNPNQQQLIYAGARIPLFYCHNGASQIIKGNRESIGYPDSDDHYQFTNHHLTIEDDMVFFMATDGYADQVGGTKQLMYGNKRFRKLLTDNYKKPFQQQQDIILSTYNSYKSDRTRRDDVTVVGFRL